jgi:glycosyltransferase involved in cell wall biosynthesis
MKVCLVNTYDNSGGAAIAAYRLHQALKRTGIDSRMLVQQRITSDGTVTGPRPGMEEKLAGYRSSFDCSLFCRYPARDRNATWSINAFPHRIAAKINALDPDIVHLHWIGSGFVPVSEIGKIKKPILWTLHDMWAFTGGCHYAGDCTRFTEKCGRCPQLGTPRFDISSCIWKRKSASFRGKDLVIVCPSRWLADCAGKSSLFRNAAVNVIPNGIDTGVFRPMDTAEVRTMLGLPHDKKLILFGAINARDDPRKGFRYLVSALEQLPATDPSLRPECVVFGRTGSAPVEIPGYRVHNLGYVPGEERLANVYSAADVFVAPSVQENLANTVLESLACGTPVVAFNIGGMPDMIDQEKNGYLVTPFSPAGMAEGIDRVLHHPGPGTLALHARRKVMENFTAETAVRHYRELYAAVQAESS